MVVHQNVPNSLQYLFKTCIRQNQQCNYGDQKFQQACHSIQDLYLFSALSIRLEINSVDVYCNSYIDAPGMIGSSTFMY